MRQIRRLLKRGVPFGEIVEDLKGEGYSAEEINGAFNHSGGDPQNNYSKSSSGFPLWYAASIGFLVLGITILLGPRLWLSRSAIPFLALGVIGVVVRTIQKGQSKH